MAVLVSLLVNALLLAVPVGVTLGILFKLQPFHPTLIPAVVIPGLLSQTLTSPFHVFAQNKIGQNYTLNSNEILPEPSSILSTNLITYQNATYPSNTTAPQFSFTWTYPYRPANASAPANQSTPAIHAFPQIRISDNSILPLTLENLGEMDLDVSWTMGVGSEPSYATSTRRLGAHNVNATVALDMYFDANITRSADASLAAFEMLVLFARFGNMRPVGDIKASAVLKTALQGTDFELFVGTNSNKQTVFTWIPSQPVYQFQGDISPLFDRILSLQPTGRPSATNWPGYEEYIGYVGFGTQAFNAEGNITFHVSSLSMDLRPF